MPACELNHQVLDVTAPMPLTITVSSTQISGTRATSTDAVTSTVARWLVTLRRALTPWNVETLTGLSNVDVMKLTGPFWTPRRGPVSSPRM